MSELPLWMLGTSIIVLTAMSAYFSGTETAMMALNRYRLRHLVRKRHRPARKANRALKRPDRLLGGILVGNNLVNFTAATIATVIGMRLFGDLGVLMAPWVLTLMFLIFAEVTPKTIAAKRPESWAFRAIYVLDPLQKILHPAVVLIGWVANGIVRLVTRGTDEQSQSLSLQELRTVVDEGAKGAGERRTMMMRLIDLESVTVNDIMVPRNEIIGIDIEDDLDDIIDALAASQHTLLPVYKENINNILGILHLRRMARFVDHEELSKAELMQQTREPYYVPEATSLDAQLHNFQKEKQRIALVVDEYGDVQGIVTLEDILEEIVGEFTSDFASNMEEISAQDDGTFVIDGSAMLRDINRALRWDLPLDGPRTLNGLVLEHLETIPDANLSLRLDRYQIETLQIRDNRITNLRIRELEAAAVDPEDDEDLDPESGSTNEETAETAASNQAAG